MNPDSSTSRAWKYYPENREKTAIEEIYNHEDSIADVKSRSNHYGPITINGNAATQFGDRYEHNTYNLIVGQAFSRHADELSNELGSSIVNAEELRAYLSKLDGTARASSSRESKLGNSGAVTFKNGFNKFVADRRHEPSGPQGKGRHLLHTLVQDLMKVAKEGQTFCDEYESLEELAQKFDDLSHESLLLYRLLKLCSVHEDCADDPEGIEESIQRLNSVLLRTEYIYHASRRYVTADDPEAWNVAELTKQLEKSCSSLKYLKATMEMDLQFKLKVKKHAIVQQAHDVARLVTSVHDCETTRSDQKAVIPRRDRSATSWSENGPSSGMNKAKGRRKLRIPWFAKRCFEVALSYQANSFYMGWQCYTIIDDENPMFEAIRIGDLKGLRESLVATSTLKYQSIDGETLLSCALRFSNVEIVRLLLQGGVVEHLDSQIDAIGMVLAYILEEEFESLDTMSKTRQCWNVIMDSHGGEDEALQYIGRRYLENIRSPWSVWLNHLPQVLSVGLTTLPLQFRYAMALDASLTDFKNLLTASEIDETVQSFIADEITGYAAFVAKIANHPPATWALWTSLVRDILNLTSFDQLADDWAQTSLKISHRQYARRASPIWTTLRYVSKSCWTQCVNRVCCKTRQWLVYLHRIGVDLEHYGEAEKLFFNWRNEEKIWWDGVQYQVYLFTGPHYDDWKILGAPLDIEYELAGTFWSMVENPELFAIPGQFVDDDQEHEFANHQLEQHYSRDLRFIDRNIIHSKMLSSKQEAEILAALDDCPGVEYKSQAEQKVQREDQAREGSAGCDEQGSDVKI